MGSDFGKEDYMQKQGAPKSLGRASLLYDVLNDVTLDAHLESYKTSEKALFVKHLEKIQNKFEWNQQFKLLNGEVIKIK